MKVILAGASGLIGGALASKLTSAGHEVRRLVRRAPSSSDEVRWSPERGEIEPGTLPGVDAVICLSGAGVGDHRWTDEYRQVIRDSRVETVGALARAVAETSDGPRVLICASAVGYYGDTGDTIVDESSPSGDSFLASVCQDWEAAADPARAAGLRVVHLRTGLVLAPKAGLLARLAPLFKLGAGGRMGNGRQYWPWISLADELGAISFLLGAETISGPVNLTGPTPVTNAEFTATLARAVHRPALVPVPGFALRVALGEFAGEILAGQRAVPATLTAGGFEFQHPTLESALTFALA